jgi:predicted dinucleotide-binding enzyme
MRIGIIGSGHVGGALGVAWAERGHDVFFGSREPDSARIRGLLEQCGGRARAGEPEGAARFGDVVLLAVPWGAVAGALESLADSLEGKVLMDATNPFGPRIPEGTSGGETVARLTPGVQVVKAFNTIGANLMANPQLGTEPATMPLASDFAPAKRAVAGLAAELGFEPLDCGPLSSSAALESLARAWVGLSKVIGRDFAFRVLKG